MGVCDIVENVRGEVVKLNSIKRSAYTTAESYILAFQNKYNKLARYKVEPHPFNTLFTLLPELEEESRTIEHFYENVKDKVPDAFTEDDFKRQCSKLIRESRDKGIAIANTARDSKKTKDQEDKPAKGKSSKKEDTKPKSKKDDEESSKPRWKNAPPKGTSAEDWAEEQK
ncbi:unnamed protein product [Penicillium camemberti]|uniref:Str. FM013 n=1 Tax=Penicillium camemberti (strain FM 013) TaxID=1429867 RepID=A0A0G4P399_PENC3|nr:unnamed protein product [Penicillium camemberti]